MDWTTELVLSTRMAVAGFVGGVIGLDRELTGHPAGARTHATVALGSCLFSLISMHHGQMTGADETRIAAQVASGIGFIGAGVIMRERFKVKGLTTAASLWTTASIGMAAGYGYYILTFVATGLVLGVLVLQYFPWWQRLTLALERRKPKEPGNLTEAQKHAAFGEGAASRSNSDSEETTGESMP